MDPDFKALLDQADKTEQTSIHSLFETIRTAEEEMLKWAIILLDECGSLGVFALEHTLRRIYDHRTSEEVKNLKRLP